MLTMYLLNVSKYMYIQMLAKNNRVNQSVGQKKHASSWASVYNFSLILIQCNIVFGQYKQKVGEQNSSLNKRRGHALLFTPKTPPPV